MTDNRATSPLDYYAQHGPVTDPQEQAGWFAGLPREIPALCSTVQGILLHIFWAERYGVNLPEERKQEVQLRAVARQLARLQEIEAGLLTVARPPEKRLVGNCRDFSTLLCAILRHQGVPARARCGFSAYFRPDRYEDHWVCECWNAAERRWVMVDSQLDALQREVLHIGFDPCDLPPGRFLTGGQAWRMARSGQVDAGLFGIFDMHGLWFIAGDLVRDFLALNRIEILPWDPWGLMFGPEEAPGPEHLAALDRLADLTLAGDDAFAGLRAAYEQDDRLRMPVGWQP